MLFLSRSALESLQTCPRLYYLTYLHQGKGIVPAKQSADLAIGIARHAGVQSLIGGESLDVALDKADSSYVEETQCGLEDSGSWEADMRREHRAIIEAGLRVWAVVRLPVIKEMYEVLEVEKERSVELIPGKVIFEGRPDADLRLKSTGQIFSFSLKNPRQYGPQRHKDCQIDMQGRSESWLLGNIYGHEMIGGVQMEYIMAGVPKKDEFDAGEYIDPTSVVLKPIIRWTPLIRGWARATPEGFMEYAWRQKWDNPSYRPDLPWSPKNAKQNSFTKASRFVAWDYADGVKGWVNDLINGQFIPKFKNPVDEILYAPDPYVRSTDQVNAWLDKTIMQATEIVDKLDDLQAGRKNLNQTFPGHETSCVNKFGLPCKMWSICHEGAGVDPMNNGFKPREPHHSGEMESQI